MTTAAGENEQDSVAKYVAFVEHNEWEGETWHFYVPVAGNEEALGQLRQKIALPHWQDPDDDPPQYTLQGEVLSEAEVDTLVKHGDTDGYMAEHQKLSGRLDVEGLTKPEGLYKGGIKTLMRE